MQQHREERVGGRAALKLLRCLGFPVVQGGDFSEGFISFDNASSPAEGGESPIDKNLQFQVFSWVLICGLKPGVDCIHQKKCVPATH